MRSRTPSVNGSVCPSPYGSMHKKVISLLSSSQFLLLLIPCQLCRLTNIIINITDWIVL